jgi:hypothetical protein
VRVLVATRETQGERDDDYCWTVDGELVRLPLADCANPACGCVRGFAGLSSHRATTTALIEEWSTLDPDRYAELIRADLLDGFDDEGDPEVEASIEEELDFLDTLLMLFPPGTVLQRHGPNVSIRRQPPGGPVTFDRSWGRRR